MAPFLFLYPTFCINVISVPKTIKIVPNNQKRPKPPWGFL